MSDQKSIEPFLNTNIFKIVIDGKFTYIQFAKNISKSSSNKDDLFRVSSEPDRSFILKSERRNRDNKLNVTSFPNFPLFKICTISEFRFILAFIFETNISNISVRKINYFDDKYTQEAYDEAVSIGNDNFDINISRISGKMGMFSDGFYKNYEEIREYMTSISNLHKDKIVISPIIQWVMVQLKYTNAEAESPSGANQIVVDIVKLFNLHSPGKFNRIYIHSDALDSFMSNPRPYQYLKMSNKGINVFKGVVSKYNACVLYYGDKINSGIILSRIEIYPDGSIIFAFNNMSTINTLDEIQNSIQIWMKQHSRSLLDDLLIGNCTYISKFSTNKYSWEFADISGSATFDKTTLSDINSVTNIFRQNIPSMKFTTKTSIQFNGYGFNSNGSLRQTEYLRRMAPSITLGLLQKDLLPNVHVSADIRGTITITISGAFNYDNLYCNIAMIAGMFKHEVLPIISTRVMSVAGIRKKCASISSNDLLNKLKDIDSLTFGSREVPTQSGKKRDKAYSGLVQKTEQRPVPIEFDEYMYLRSAAPKSVVDIMNQTTKSRLYLFCPDPEHTIFNYHKMPGNQLCVPRCTKGPSGKPQYLICSNMFDSNDIIDMGTKYENTGITVFNPLLSIGRKCQLPIELSSIGTYILMRIDPGNNLQSYIRNEYEKEVIHIHRMYGSESYKMLTDYNSRNDYVICLTDESVANSYFLIINERGESPLLLSKEPNLRNFIASHNIKTTSQLNFFSYISRLISMSLDDLYDQSITDIFQILYDEYGFTYVIKGKNIIGVIWDKLFYLTPIVPWSFDNTKLFILLRDMLSKPIRLPSINDFDPEYISKVYMDYSTSEIKMIEFSDVGVLIKPTRITSKISHINVLYFDFNSVMYSLFDIGKSKKQSDQSFSSIFKVIDNILLSYIIHIGEISEISKDNLISFGESIDVITKSKTKIEFIPDSDIPFWRNCQISINDISRYMAKSNKISLDNIISTLYDKIMQDLSITLPSNTILESKILTT